MDIMEIIKLSIIFAIVSALVLGFLWLTVVAWLYNVVLGSILAIMFMVAMFISFCYDIES